MKKVYFIIPSKRYGSAIMRGYQVSRQLQKEGIHTSVIDLSCDYRNAVKIRNSIVIFVKNAVRKNHNLIAALKKNKNILIWDIVDCIIEQYNSVQDFLDEEQEILTIFDGTIFVNYRCRHDWQQYFKNSCISQVIYHHWDPRLKPNCAKKFSLVYVGGLHNLKWEYLKSIPELCLLPWVNSINDRRLFKKIVNYNCHFSIRKEGGGDFNYKSNVKLSCAAATNSNIILSRDPSFTDLLDNLYPYYTNSDLRSVQKTLKLAQETYASKIWHNALDMMSEVRNKTSLKKICRDYIQYLKHF